MFGKDLSAFIADKMQRCNRTCREASTLIIHKIFTQKEKQIEETVKDDFL